MWMRTRLIVMTLALSMLNPAFAAEPTPKTGLDHEKLQDVGDGQGDNDYRIGPEDVLDISIWNNTAVSRTVPVRPDGKISLPLVNDVQAAGLTPMKLRTLLIKKLSEFIPAPEISIIVREVHSFKVSVIGEVKKTGRHELKGRTTVLDVLALAEGFGEFAAKGKIVVLRPAGDRMEQIPFNYNKILNNGATENFYLQPGDIIVVP